MSQNPELQFTLDEAVSEVMTILTGLPLTYEAESDKYYSVAATINRAQRFVATESDWSWYASLENVGQSRAGMRTVDIRASLRPRIIGNDAVRLSRDDVPVVWAYFMPRDALHTIPDRMQLWAAHNKSTIEFSRALFEAESGLDIMVPVMREPKMFRLPAHIDAASGAATVPDDVREQLIDFQWPDLVIAKTAYLYAQSVELFQPRVQTLEANYTDLMYALKARDTQNTDSPFLNPYRVEVDSDIDGGWAHSHRPYSDWKY